MSNPWNLARLLGDAHATFFRDHWERAPLVLHPDDPTRYGELLSVADLDAHVFGRNAMHPAVSLTDANRKLGPAEYTYASGLIDNARAAQHFAEGATMIFAGLEGSLAPLAALCRAMEAELSVRFQTNVYRTPGNAQGFQTHYDSHDVFALQVQGKKLWTLYDTPVALPFRRQEFHPREVPVGEVTQTFTLGPGDLAYVPRGVLHDARNVDGEDSLHITLGVLHTSWTDLIAESLARFGLRDTEMRRGMPRASRAKASTAPRPASAFARSSGASPKRPPSTTSWTTSPRSSSAPGTPSSRGRSSRCASSKGSPSTAR